MVALFMTKRTNDDNLGEVSEKSVSVSESEKQIEVNEMDAKKSILKIQEQSVSLSEVEEGKSEVDLEPDLESGH